MQEKLAEEMLSLARSLKNNTLAAQNVIKQDNQVAQIAVQETIQILSIAVHNTNVPRYGVNWNICNLILNVTGAGESLLEGPVSILHSATIESSVL